MGGTYRLEGNVLIVENGSMTAMGCDPALMEQDGWISAFLGSQPLATLSGNGLRLVDGETVIDLLDREVAEPDVPLVGRPWTLAGIVAGEVVSSVPVGVEASLEFTPDGQVRYATGCNEGSGRVTVDGTALVFSDLVTTDRACPGAAGDVEAAVTAVLTAARVEFRVEASSLSLATATGGLELTSR
jgi:heat shock protein HslJ